jgi:hypothetical protein
MESGYLQSFNPSAAARSWAGPDKWRRRNFSCQRYQNSTNIKG